MNAKDKGPAPAGGPDGLGEAAAALDREAALERAGPGAAAPVPAPVIKDWVGEARDLVNFAVDLCTPAWPSLANVYTPEKRAAIVAAAAPLMEKYNFDLGAWAIELRFLMVTVPLIAPTFAAIRADNAAAKNAPAAQAAPAAAAVTVPPAGAAVQADLLARAAAAPAAPKWDSAAPA